MRSPGALGGRAVRRLIARCYPDDSGESAPDLERLVHLTAAHVLRRVAQGSIERMGSKECAYGRSEATLRKLAAAEARRARSSAPG